jgi:hypothetical protein
MTDDRKQELIERYRTISVDHEWWDSTYDDFKSICRRMGIDLDMGEPSFQGFWSQGDGASFTGIFNADIADTAPETIRNYAPIDKELHRIADELCMLGRVYYRAYAQIGRPYGSHHCHSHTMFVANYAPLEGDVDDWADEVHTAVETGLQGLFRDLADWLYNTLERKYDYLTSDEAVWGTIVANELDREDEDEDACV